MGLFKISFAVFERAERQKSDIIRSGLR